MKVKNIVLGTGAGILLFATAAGVASKSAEIATSTPQSVVQTVAPPSNPAADISIKNNKFTVSGTVGMLVGEVTNNGTVEHTMFLKATFYAADGSILGTATGAVNELQPGQTKTYTLMTVDKVTGYAKLKVDVDSIF